MKRFFGIFVLMPAEQRLVIILVVLLVAGAWFKHHYDLQNTGRPKPAPQGTAISKSPAN